MNQKFNIGDRVRILWHSVGPGIPTGYSDIYGETGKIDTVFKKHGTFRIELDDPSRWPRSPIFGSRDMELIESLPTKDIEDSVKWLEDIVMTYE